MALLSPHFRRAAMIGDLLDHERVQTASFRAGLERLQAPVILVESTSHVLYANPAAQALFEAGQVIQQIKGRCVPANDSVKFAMSDALLRAAGSDADLGGRGIGIPLSLAGQAIAVAYILPLKNSEARSVFTTASAAIFISITTAGVPPHQQVLARLYDLTPTEARVMSLLGAGLTANAAAMELGVTQNTVKTHLARVYSKTAVPVQAALATRAESALPAVAIMAPLFDTTPFSSPASTATGNPPPVSTESYSEDAPGVPSATYQEPPNVRPAKN